ncbi:NAD(P)H-binding protein, partial [Vibrio parahaemolyticus]|nr:NAD(P)H-binding protein [Vibrio parahaemolyticus]
MQTILGASGQIGRELALSLKRDFTSDIRLVSRNPHRVNETDQLVKADLLDAKQTSDAVKGSSIVYLTAGLPMDTQLWVEQWPTMMRNVIAACKTHQA